MNTLRRARPARFGRPLAKSALTAALAVTASGLAFGGGSGVVHEPTIPHGVTLASWQDNGHGGQYVLQLLEGRALPAGTATTGRVLSDTECDPDANGLNHCHNAIELADGTRILVINTHVMQRNRCLGTGDKLAITALDRGWFLGKLAAR